MARLLVHEALLLRCIDIGEADRFCILLTRKRGRIAARARSVRKPGSRMGGILLPYHHVRLELSETDHSLLITSASLLSAPVENMNYACLSRIQQGIELVLQLTEDDEPMPAVFDLLLTFFHAANIEECDPVLPFTVHLLHLLGLLPSSNSDPRFARLSTDAQREVRDLLEEANVELLCHPLSEEQAIRRFVDSVLSEHLTRPLKTAHLPA